MKVSVTGFIFKDLDTVYQSIIQKNKITKYFVSSADYNLGETDAVHWEWSDYNASCVITQVKVDENKSISFYWGASGEEKKVVITLTPIEDEKTKIHIEEGDFENVPAEIEKMMGQTQGWTDFICSLKAFLYTGINLRNGKMN